MKPQLRLLLVAGIAVLLALLLLSTSTTPEATPTLKPLSMPTSEPQTQKPKASVATTKPDAMLEDVVDEVLEQLAPEYHLIQCENAGVLENGLYRLRQQSVSEHDSDECHERVRT